MTRHICVASASFARFDSWWRITPWLVFLASLMARFVYVSLYADSVPFWDQWDGEADRLLLPWLGGTWHWLNLFSPHNEHRIALTRLLTLILFELNNHQWDNLVEAYACAVVFAAMNAMLYAQLCKGLPGSLQRLGLLAFIVLLAALPFAWENIVCGFQSQFYFMALIAIAMQTVAAFGTHSSRDAWLLMILAVISLFTMASGLIACLAAVVTVAVRHWSKESTPPYFAASIFVGMALVAITGLMITPSLPDHESLKAHGLFQHASSLLINLAWPWQPSLSDWWPLAILLLWMPTFMWVIQLLQRRQFSRADAFIAGMLVWVGLQFLAIAHARGHEMSALSSRYMDIPAIGMALNMYLVLTQLTTPGRLPGWIVAAAFLAIAGLGLARRQSNDMDTLNRRHAFTMIETKHVRDYLATGNPANLQQPRLCIPYPDAIRLQSWLDNPTIRSTLPRLTNEDYYSTQGLGRLSIMAMKWQALLTLSSNEPSTTANSLQR